ncbi:hypothetical protein LIER_27333 [Lithospermum erythrorhizon]|uniref:Uncharacterized protein n=1 Tax=Lithospermum erythrorhizon TaxID=34254 RepID=A0AAV3RBM8_LITER
MLVDDDDSDDDERPKSSINGGASLPYNLRKKEGGSYERVTMRPYNFTGRLEGRLAPPLIDANLSAKHMKRKVDDERYGDSANDGFQDGKMK